MILESAIALYAGGPGSGCNPKVGKCGRPKGSGSDIVSRMRKNYDDLIGMSARVVTHYQIKKVWKNAGIKLADKEYTRVLERFFGGKLPAGYRFTRAQLVGVQAMADALKEMSEKGKAEKELVDWVKQNMTFRCIGDADNGVILAMDGLLPGASAQSLSALRRSEPGPIEIVMNGNCEPDRLLHLVMMDKESVTGVSLSATHGIDAFKKNGSMVDGIYAMYKASLIHELGHVLDGRKHNALSEDLLARVGRDPYRLDDVLGKVSSYATSSPVEGVAEMFLSKQLGLPVPAELDVFAHTPYGAHA